jgi:predicted permease
VINDQIRRANPDRWTFGAILTGLQQHLTGRFRRGLLLLLAAVGAVLLIACTNLSNLLLARAASRRKEIAIRSALGASRWRLLRQMLTESLVLSSSGAAVGLALAWIATRSLASSQRVSIPLLRTVEIDGTALLFTALVALATALLFGIVPALQGSGSNDAESLKQTGRGLSEGGRTASTRGILVISEVALACVLLVGAGLLIRSFLRVLDVDLGFQPERAAAWRIDTAGRYDTDPQRVAFYDRLVRAVEAVPGVESAGITDALPLSRDRTWGIRARGVNYPKDQIPVAHPRLIDHRYLRTMRIPLGAGRYFTAADTATSPRVIIINQKLARLLWPGQDPIGQTVVDGGMPRVVGVVGNVRHQALEDEGGPELYIPITQDTSGSVELVVRARLAPEALAPAVRAALRAVDPALPTVEFHPLGELVNRAVSPRRFLMLLLAGFALAALLLASVGIYGVVSYTVAQRTQEIGIRMALGASPGQVQRHVMARTVALVSGGIFLGVAGALALARLAASLLYRLEPADPPTFLLTVSVLVTVAAIAGYLPALRASRVDPISALRSE